MWSSIADAVRHLMLQWGRALSRAEMDVSEVRMSSICSRIRRSSRPSFDTLGFASRPLLSAFGFALAVLPFYPRRGLRSRTRTFYGYLPIRVGEFRFPPIL